jgi:hypothetical protein
VIDNGEPEHEGNAWSIDVEAAEDSGAWVPPGHYDAIVIRGDVYKFPGPNAKSLVASS